MRIQHMLLMLFLALTLNTFAKNDAALSGLNLTCPEDIIISAPPGASSTTVFWTEPTVTTDCQPCPNQGDVCASATADCMDLELLQLQENNDGSITYTFNLTSNCHQALSYIAFELPSPYGASSFGAVNRSYTVENTTNNPFYSIKYEANGEGIKQGESDTFYYTLPAGAPLLTTIDVKIKVAQDEYMLFLDTENCDEYITCDNGGSGTTTVTQTGGLSNGADFPIGTTTITYQATDDCGNVETCSFDIIVNSTSAVLTLACSGDISAIAPPGQTTANVVWTEPVATTTCFTGNVTLTQLAGPENGGVFPVGTTTVGYEAVDDCGNSEICAFTVNVSLYQANLVIVSCPVDVSAVAPSGASGAIVSWTAPTANTDCPLNNIVVNQVEGLANGSEFPVGTTTVSYEVIDDCFSLKTCSFDVVVTGPTSNLTILNCPNDITFPVNPDGSNEATVFWTEPGVSTDCPTNAATINQVAGLSNGSNFPLGTTTVEYEATDDCGTIEMCTFSVIVEPFPSTMQVNCPPDLTVVVPEGDQTGTIAWEMPVATSTCPVPGTTVTQVGGPASGGDFPLGTTEITYEATDFCGNVVTCSFDVNVVGDGTITPNCPVLPDVLTLAGETTAIVSWAEPTGTTTCPQGGVVATQTSGPANGTPFPVGISSIMYTFTDACGNVTTCLFKVRVNQNTQPDGYCDSEGISTSEEWIDQVEYVTIDNLSGDDNGYGDYTNLLDVVTLGSTTTITLTPGFSGQVYDEYWRVCIDWNQDGDFADAGEIVIEQNSTTTITESFTVPTTALTGQTRMRVSMKRGSYPDKCELMPEGEVEDYTLTVSSGGLMANTVVTTVTTTASDETEQKEEVGSTLSTFEMNVFPNPARDLLNITLKDVQAQEGSIQIFNQVGKLVKDSVYGLDRESTITIDLDGFGNGVYFLVFIEGENKVIKPFVVQH